MEQPLTPPELRDILATLGAEVQRPIEALRGEIDRLLGDLDDPASDPLRGHTETMRTVCDEMSKLTEECLGVGQSADPPPDPSCR